MDDSRTPTHSTTGEKLAWLEQLRDESLHAGSEKAVARQHEQGKLLARERAERLCDPGSFVELDRFVRHRESNFGMLDRRPYGDAVVTVAERDADEAAQRSEAFVARSAWFAQQVLADPEVNQPPQPASGPDGSVPATLPRRSVGHSGSSPRTAARPRKI